MWQAAGMIPRSSGARFASYIAATSLALVVAACGVPEKPSVAEPRVPLVVTPPAEREEAPVVRRELPPAVASVPAPPPPATSRPTLPTLPPIAVPADAIYVCVVESGGTLRQTVIEFVPKVHQLCRRHPEMGPCQYERNACRGAGGRVFAAGGQEITMATEAEYDRKVMRVRFRAN